MDNSFTYDVVQLHTLVGEVSQILLMPSTQSVLSYEAGQYVNVHHHDHSVSPLSIACAPSGTHSLEFHLFHPLENRQSRDLLRMAQDDKSWKLSGPFGHCTMACLNPLMPVIFIARGTGFASVKAMIEALSKAPRRSPMYFYWSMPLRDDFYMKDLLEQWRRQIENFDFTLLSRDQHADKTESLCEVLLRDRGDLSDFQVYASGSPAFVNAAFSSLSARGLKRDFYHSDVFF